MKRVVLLLLLTLVIPSVAPESFARPQYLTNLSTVYGNGSCGTCHVIASGGGPRNSNGTFGQHNPDGTYVPSYGTLFENQPEHAADPSAALIAIGQPPTETAAPANTGTQTQVAPGFEIVVSLIGLFAGTLLARRHNK
ncbi:MAG: PGF-CTERM sorting domain-containing protein [Candidatus Methanoperedens sp.]|nr:PGF-CTERM sorting domain-containing protein [Candidatus Methanoperedens sp.]